jgi:RimJ/RimL family protein N-acetyltransferase
MALRYIQQSHITSEELVLAIIVSETQAHIGNIALQQIHPIYHSAEFSIVIGDKDYWNKGYGKEAGKLLCDHGFERLNLHRIYCGTFDNNNAMKTLALSLGMKEEGMRKEAAFTQGRYVDVIEYGMTKKDYENFWNPKQKGEKFS